MKNVLDPPANYHPEPPSKQTWTEKEYNEWRWAERERASRSYDKKQRAKGSKVREQELKQRKEEATKWLEEWYSNPYNEEIWPI